MSTENPTSDYFVSLSNYRARTAELYSDVRRSTASNEETWQAWLKGRLELLETHPMSAFADNDLAPAPMWDYDEQWRTTGKIVEADLDDLLLGESETKIRNFSAIGNIEFAVAGTIHSLPIYWADSYGGGWFLPFRDATNGTDTFGSGRYALDGAKGADLGTTDNGELIIDFNYAVHPSCVWGNWLCPLPSANASLPIAVTAGEQKH